MKNWLKVSEINLLHGVNYWVVTQNIKSPIYCEYNERKKGFSVCGDVEVINTDRVAEIMKADVPKYEPPLTQEEKSAIDRKVLMWLCKALHGRCKTLDTSYSVSIVDHEIIGDRTSVELKWIKNVKQGHPFEEKYKSHIESLIAEVKGEL